MLTKWEVLCVPHDAKYWTNENSSKAQREKLWNLQMGFNFHRFYTKTFTIHPVQFYQMQLCLKCRALSQILIVSTFQTSALQEIPFFGFFKGPLLSTKAGEPVIFSILCMEHEEL